MANIDKNGYIKTEDASGNIVTLYPYTKAGNVDGLDVFGASGSGHSSGLVPDPGATSGSSKFLCENGTWAEPSGGGGAVTGVKGNSESSYRTGNVNLTPANIGAATSDHTHGNITNDGKLQTTDVSIASGDKLVITDSSDSSKIARTSISFDGSTTTQALTKKGTWGTFLTSHQSLSGYVPTSRTINGYDLSANRSLTYSDVGAASSGHTHSSASTSSAGFMSSTDKSRLNGLYDSMANMRSLKSNPVFDLKHIQVILANQTWTASDGGMYYCTPINSGLSHIFSISLGGYGALKSSLVIIPSRSANNTQTFTLLSNTNSFSQWANVYVLIFGLA